MRIMTISRIFLRGVGQGRAIMMADIETTVGLTTADMTTTDAPLPPIITLTEASTTTEGSEIFRAGFRMTVRTGEKCIITITIVPATHPAEGKTFLIRLLPF